MLLLLRLIKRVALAGPSPRQLDSEPSRPIIDGTALLVNPTPFTADPALPHSSRPRLRARVSRHPRSMSG